MRLSWVANVVRDVCPPLLVRQAGRLRRKIRPWASEATHVLSTREGIDAMIDSARAAAQGSHDVLREHLARYRFRFPTELPQDAEGPEYREAQLALYRLISGRDGYSADECEPHQLDRDAALDLPFPYCTHSSHTVGGQLMAMGFLIRAMNLAPGGRVLEFGPGYGKLTAEMAQTGYDVTAVDINPDFADVVERRCRQVGRRVTVALSSMLDFASEEPFDRVVFYESFHHCADPVAMVRRFGELVREGGAVVFGGEPVVENFPMPWGVRLDGESLYAIRVHGWLELGYQTRYFYQLLRRHGWRVEAHRSVDVPWQVVYVARRAAPGGR